MEFELTEEQQMVKDMARRFAEMFAERINAAPFRYQVGGGAGA